MPLNTVYTIYFILSLADVQLMAGKNEIAVPMTNPAAGLYILKTASQEGVQTARFSVTK